MRTIFLLAVMLLTACSSQPPQTATYLLRSGTAMSSGAQLAGTGIALGTVRVATYIEQPGLVLATGDGKIQVARNHVWAEPLTVSLRRFLAEEISTAAGKYVSPTPVPDATTRVNVVVDQLHGDGRGAAVLVAFWELQSDQSSAAFQFSEQQVLSSDGYDALVQAEEALLRRLASAIAGSLGSS